MVILLLIALVTPQPKEVVRPDPAGQVEWPCVTFHNTCRFYERNFGEKFRGRWTVCVSTMWLECGLREGDHIVRLNSTPVDNQSDFYDAWFRLRPGAVIEIHVVNGLRPRVVTYTVREAPR